MKFVSYATKAENAYIRLGHCYYLGALRRNGAWMRLTLFHRQYHPSGETIKTPVGEVDIIKHPSADGCNAHSEINIILRNDVKKVGDEIVIDRNKVKLRQPDDIVDKSIIRAIPSLLVTEGIAPKPLSIYLCVRHISSFKVRGTFWNNESK